MSRCGVRKYVFTQNSSLWHVCVTCGVNIYSDIDATPWSKAESLQQTRLLYGSVKILAASGGCGTKISTRASFLLSVESVYPFYREADWSRSHIVHLKRQLEQTNEEWNGQIYSILNPVHRRFMFIVTKHQKWHLSAWIWFGKMMPLLLIV